MTTETLALTQALSRRIELSEARAGAQAADALNRARPGEAAVLPVAGGFAVYCGANSPVTQAIGLGLDGPVCEEEFERLEEFYRSRGEPIRVETSPLADASLFALFGEHGYRVTEFTNVMARPIEEATLAETDGHATRNLRVERCERNQLDLWALTVVQGFSETHPVTPELLEVMKLFAIAPDTEFYLAYADGKVAGGGTLALREGVGGLFGASTLPAFRNRGVQTALLRARLRRAAEAGCDLAVSLAQPGSASQRNIVRQGFQVLYTRVKFERDHTEK